jgi:hypothetical protein
MRAPTFEGAGCVTSAPSAPKEVSCLAAEAQGIAQKPEAFKDAGLCWLASCLARRHRVALSVATVAAEQRWRP